MTCHGLSLDTPADGRRAATFASHARHEMEEALVHIEALAEAHVLTAEERCALRSRVVTCCRPWLAEPLNGGEVAR